MEKNRFVVCKEENLLRFRCSIIHKKIKNNKKILKLAIDNYIIFFRGVYSRGGYIPHAFHRRGAFIQRFYKRGVFMTKLGAFAIGIAVGGVGLAIVKTAGFKKLCSKVVSAGMQLKDEAASFVETIKEDAEDIKAEAVYNKNAAAQANS